jgi:hypothetical protein
MRIDDESDASSEDGGGLNTGGRGSNKGDRSVGVNYLSQQFLASIEGDLHPLFSPAAEPHKLPLHLAFPAAVGGDFLMAPSSSGLSPSALQAQSSQSAPPLTNEDLRIARVEATLQGFPSGQTGIVFSHDPMLTFCDEWSVKTDMDDIGMDFNAMPGGSPSRAETATPTHSGAFYGAREDGRVSPVSTASLMNITRRESLQSTTQLPTRFKEVLARRESLQSNRTLTVPSALIIKEKRRDTYSNPPPSSSLPPAAPQAPSAPALILRRKRQSSVISQTMSLQSPEAPRTNSNEASPANRLSPNATNPKEKEKPNTLSEFIAHLAAEIQSAPHLQSLLIHHVPLMKTHVAALVQRGIHSMQHTNLQKLTINFATLGAAELGPLCEWIATAPTAVHLKYLDLAHNQVNSDALEMIRLALSTKNCLLEFLSVRNNPLGDAGAVSLVTLIAEISCLRGIDIGFCELNDVTIVKLGGLLQTTGKNLTHLILDGASVTQRGAVMLLDAVESSRSLLYFSTRYMYYCNGRTYLRKVNKVLRRNAARKLRDRPDSAPRNVGSPLPQLVSPLDPGEASPRILRGSPTTSSTSPVIGLFASPTSRGPGTFRSTVAQQHFAMTMTMKLMDSHARSSGWSSSSESDEEDKTTEEQYADETFGYWELRGLKRGYHRYTTNTPSAALPKERKNPVRTKSFFAKA